MSFFVSLSFSLLCQTPAPDHVRHGMTSEEVRRVLGPPTRVARQVLHRRYVEQWWYQKGAMWVDFDGSKGQELRVRNVVPRGIVPRR
jgi:hypothetical protein